MHVINDGKDALAHQFAAELLKENLLDRKPMSNVNNFRNLYSDMFVDIDFYLIKVGLIYNHIKKNSKAAKLIIFKNIDISNGENKDFITCDVAILSDEVTYIIDFDYSEENRHIAKGDPDLLSLVMTIHDCYGDKYPAKKYVTMIYQPLMDNISTWSICTKNFAG